MRSSPLLKYVIHTAILLLIINQRVAFAQTPAAPVPAATPSPDKSKPNPKAAAQELEAITESLLLQGLMDPFDYDPRGRKDPFTQPIPDRPVAEGAPHGPLLPLQKFDLSQLRLVGIMWDVKRPRAMIQDPNKKIHTVGPYTKIGVKNGYVAVIREGELVIVETIEDGGGRLTTVAQIMKLIK